MVRMIFDDTEKGAKPTVILEGYGPSEAVITHVVYLVKQFMLQLSDDDKELLQATISHFIVEDHDA